MATPGGIADRGILLHSAAVATADGTSLEVGNSHGGGNFPVVSFQITGISGDTITFEATADGTNWVSFRCVDVATGIAATTATANGIYRGAAVGFWKVRARISTYSAGTITVKAMRVVAGPLDEAGAAIAAIVPGTGATNLGKAEDAVHASGDTGVMALAVRKDTAAAVAADGDYIPLTVDGTGRLWTHVDSITASETLIGLVGSPDTYLTLTPTLDTSAYASGDTLFDATELASVGRTSGGNVVLQSVTVMDKADQKIALTLYFFDRSVTFGTANAAPSISDADTFFYMGHIDIAAGDYDDLGGAAVAVVRGLGLQMKPNTTSLYVAATTGGAPTYGASDLKFGFGFLRS